MNDKKQPNVEHHKEQPKCHKLCLWIKQWWWLSAIMLWGLLIASHYLSVENRTADNHTFLTIYLLVLAVICGLVLRWPKIITSSPKKYFITKVLATGVTGGVFAFLLPVAVKSTTTGIGGLRHSILLATGGLIAILTLGETRRKNDNDKDKNDKDYQRQVRAERRERYTKAVEQLGDEKASVRMGGVYTLVGLVDEWLEDNSINKYEDKLKEGQVIINNLCAYIRSPLTLASRKENLRAEADVRLGIIKEIHDRLQGSGKNAPGAWSDFEYDFSGSTFFYPIDLTNSYYAKPINFSGSTYWAHTNFSHSTYEQNATFSTSNSPSTYKGTADFSGSTYWAHTNFSHSTYEQNATFITSTYKGTADFSGSTYWAHTNFSHSTYEQNATFSSCFSHSMYTGTADFSRSTYQKFASFAHSFYGTSATFKNSDYSTHRGSADFHESTYQGQANFSDSIYQDDANFSSSVYRSKAYFIQITYEHKADFYGSVFYTGVCFSENNSNDRLSNFVKYSPNFHDELYYANTLFGSFENNFAVKNGRGHPIYLNLEGIPLNCKFLTLKQKEYLDHRFHEIESMNKKISIVKDSKEMEKIIEMLQDINENIHKWKEKAVEMNQEDDTIGDIED